MDATSLAAGLLRRGIPGQITGAVRVWSGGGAWTLTPDPVLGPNVALVPNTAPNGLAEPMDGSYAVVTKTTNQGLPAYQSAGFSYLVGIPTTLNIQNKGAVLFVGQLNNTGLGRGFASWGQANQNYLYMTAANVPQLFLGGALALAAPALTGVSPRGVFLASWDLTPAPGARKVRWYTYDVAAGSQNNGSDVSAVASGVPHNQLWGQSNGGATNTPAISSTFQFGDQFIDTAAGVALVASLKAYWGY